ncbi:MAG: hypothetical protein DDT26_02243 [Dehalococcoidia bacterium]|nr:hypothetical protein [Chloroflexota bacterium]
MLYYRITPVISERINPFGKDEKQMTNHQSPITKRQ